MARTRTLANLRSDIRVRADIVNQTNRHTDAQLTREINQSVQELREKITQTGNSYYLKEATGTLTANTATLALPAACLRVVALDVDVDGESYALEEFSLAQRNDFGGSFVSGTNTGIPRAYRHVATTALGNSGLWLMPVPSSAYTYHLWYLPVLTDLSADGDTFDGIAGWEDWVEWDVVVKIASRDQDLELFQTANSERSRVEARILTERKRGASGPKRRIDTRGRRMTDSAYLRGRTGA